MCLGIIKNKNTRLNSLLSIRNPVKDTARLQLKGCRKIYHANSNQKKAGHALLRASGSQAVGIAMASLEQSTLPAKVKLQLFNFLKVGTRSDDFNPISPAQGRSCSCVFMNCLLREGQRQEGGLCSCPGVQPGFATHTGSLWP